MCWGLSDARITHSRESSQPVCRSLNCYLESTTKMINLLTEIVRRTRQHHAIEHATIHLLSAAHPHKKFNGMSDPFGFTIYGEISEVDLHQAVGHALLRLQAGEHHLAVHPNCGTNLVTTSVVVTAIALLLGRGKGGFMQKFSWVLSFVVMGMVISKPLGQRLQLITTLSDVTDRWVLEIQPLELGTIEGYRVIFE